MIPIVPILVFAYSLTPCFLPSIAVAQEPTRVLTNLTLIDGSGGPTRAGVTVVFVDGEITGIHSAIPSDLPDGADIADMTDRYCTPGLIDVHSHLATAPSRDGYTESVQRTLRELLGHGVTDVRDMGGDGRVLAYLARQTLLHELPGPDLHFSAILAGPRFFADPRAVSGSRGREVGKTPWAHIVRSETDLDAMMLEVKGAGAAGVKLYAGLTADLVKRIAEAARARGLRVWGHWVIAPRRTAALDGVRAGLEVVSHAHMLMHDAKPDQRQAAKSVMEAAGGSALLAEMAKRGTILDATIVAAAGLRTPPDWVRAVDCAAFITKAARAAGVLVATGSDRPAVDGVPAIHQEYALLVEKAGFTPAAVIEATTRVSATAIGIDKRRGTLAVGQEATLLIFDANPLESVAVLASPALVIKRGVIYSGPNLRDIDAPVKVLETLLPK